MAKLMSFDVCYYKSVWSQRAGRHIPGADPISRRHSLAALQQALTVPREVEHKSKAGLWAPHAMDPDGPQRRRLKNVTHVSCAVMDYDDGTPLAEALAPWMGWHVIHHTSPSNTVDTPKFRIVLPLAAPVPVQFWPRAWHWMDRRAVGDIDFKCKDASRAFYLPTKTPTNTFTAGCHDGPLLDLRPFARLPLTPHEEVVAERKKRRHEQRAGHRLRPKNAGRAVAELLRADPDARARAADALGAKIATRATGPIALRVTCPGCRRPSAWFPIENASMTGARCNHEDSCGWYGSLFDLLHPSDLERIA